MPAYPFGGHPTFAEYLVWAHQQGCEVQSGVDSQRSVAITRIVAPNGNWVIEATPQKEFLLPTTIGRLDRRLGLKSPWFSLPLEQHPDPDDTGGD